VESEYIQPTKQERSRSEKFQTPYTSGKWDRFLGILAQVTWPWFLVQMLWPKKHEIAHFTTIGSRKLIKRSNGFDFSLVSNKT